jgi:hypothetical protein
VTRELSQLLGIPMTMLPPILVRRADEIANQVWSSIEPDVSRSVTPIQLERLKPLALESLRIAFLLGARRAGLDAIAAGIKQRGRR